MTTVEFHIFIIYHILFEKKKENNEVFVNGGLGKIRKLFGRDVIVLEKPLRNVPLPPATRFTIFYGLTVDRRRFFVRPKRFDITTARENALTIVRDLWEGFELGRTGKLVRYFHDASCLRTSEESSGSIISFSKAVR